jgi:hypothetical protein
VRSPVWVGGVLASRLKPELEEELDCGREVVNHDADVVHPWIAMCSMLASRSQRHRDPVRHPGRHTSFQADAGPTGEWGRLDSVRAIGDDVGNGRH